MNDVQQRQSRHWHNPDRRNSEYTEDIIDEKSILLGRTVHVSAIVNSVYQKRRGQQYEPNDRNY